MNAAEQKQQWQRKCDQTRLRNLKARDKAGESLSAGERNLMEGLEDCARRHRSRLRKI
jgi:hypothetical protein